MRSTILCTLALLPVLAHAQVSGPKAGISNVADAPVTLEAKLVAPKAPVAPKAVPHAAATPAPAPGAPMHDEIQYKLESDPVDTAARQTGSITYTFGSEEPEATAPRLTHVVGRTLPLQRLMDDENVAYVAVRLTVDTDGIPVNLTIAHTAGAELDAQTLAAVRQYRFTPATVSHVPVKSDVTVEVKLAK